MKEMVIFLQFCQTIWTIIGVLGKLGGFVFLGIVSAWFIQDYQTSHAPARVQSQPQSLEQSPIAKPSTCVRVNEISTEEDEIAALGLIGKYIVFEFALPQKPGWVTVIPTSIPAPDGMVYLREPVRGRATFWDGCTQGEIDRIANDAIRANFQTWGQSRFMGFVDWQESELFMIRRRSV